MTEEKGSPLRQRMLKVAPEFIALVYGLLTDKIFFLKIIKHGFLTFPMQDTGLSSVRITIYDHDNW